MGRILRTGVKIAMLAVLTNKPLGLTREILWRFLSYCGLLFG